MKIVNVIGGLGNQMFVYATYIALRKQHPSESVKICTRSFVGYPLHNGYEIDRIFGTNDEQASILDLIKVAYPFFNYRTWQIMTHILPLRHSMSKCTEHIEFDYNEILRKDSCFYDGYWQNEKYFKAVRDDVILAFKFPAFRNQANVELADRLQSCNSVSCHIRRGDYLKDKRWDICSIDYYKQAISTIQEKTQIDLFCIFSDDINWCKEIFSSLLSGVDVVYVDWNKNENSFRDMQLMSLCKHNIVANSSFSWWGAWLNQNSEKIVVTPNQWMVEPWKNSPVPDCWLKIKV